MPLPREVVHAEKSQNPVSPFRGRKNRVQEPAGSFDEAHVGGVGVGGESERSERTSGGRGVRRRVRPHRGVRETLGTDVWDSTEETRRCSGGSGLLVSDGTSASSALISAFSCSPRSGLPRCAPSVSPKGGRCRWPDEAGRASRLRDQSAPAPRKPRSRAAGSGAAGKRAASGGSVPAQAPHCPGETRLSGHPCLRDGSPPRGRTPTATQAGPPSPESRDAFSRCR